MSATAPTLRDASAEALQLAFVDVLAATRRQRARTPGPELSVAQVRALWKLAVAGEMTAGEIAKAAEVTPASATGMLDTLERGGMVERRRSPDDRRRVVVTLTPEGRALVDRKRDWWASLWTETLADLSETEIEHAALVLRRVAAALEASEAASA